MSELNSAIKQICEEKNLDYDTVVSTIELALAAAYRKDFGEKNQNIKVKFDPKTIGSKVFDVKTVVEDLPAEVLAEMAREEEEREAKRLERKEAKASGKRVEENEEVKEDSKEEEGEEEVKRFNPKTDIQLSDAKLISSKAKVGEEIVTELPIPAEYGRMAAQTAKQVIIQKLREVERELIFNEFKDKEHEVVGGIIQRREGRFVLVDLGKAVGYLPIEEQIMGERYNPGERIKVYIKEVRFGHKGVEIILSRRSEEILRKIFYLEIPEVSNGLVELKNVAREAGSRSKVAIYTESESVDPVGSCIGQKGARIQTIISELGGEKVDIIEYDDDPAKYVSNALSPAKVLEIQIDEEEKKATVKVEPDKLSLAIGKNGQNVRLAARLTGWKIDIMEAESGEVKGSSEDNFVAKEEEGDEGPKTEEKEENKEVKEKKEKKDKGDKENKEVKEEKKTKEVKEEVKEEKKDK